MGVVGWTLEEENERLELAEFRRKLLKCAELQRRRDGEDRRGGRLGPVGDDDGDCRERLVCVTSGVSFLGLAIVNRLLLRGYPVRIVVDYPEEVERLREMESSGEMRSCNGNAAVATAKATEVESLVEAFDGCYAVIHTSAFVDPAGLSGYSKSMAEMEVKVSENVMVACSRTPSVRHCVMTSSLLACIWRDGSQQDLPSVINHDCWSDELFCLDKKLWFALGKLRAEKAAWRIANEMGMKLTTICPGLITGPEFSRRNPTATFAYLKGAQEMYGKGLLATVDVNRLADAHVKVLEAMSKTAFGRYICFDQVIEREDKAEDLAMEMGVQSSKISGNVTCTDRCGSRLSNNKLTSLMSRTIGSCHDQIQS